MISRKGSIVLLFSFFIQVTIIVDAFGQKIAPAFRHFTTENGLPSSEVYTVIQDKKGNMWFGTDRGLVCFDGYDFKTFSYHEGLTDNTVFKLYEDIKGRIWMITFSGKIFFCQNEKITPFKYNSILLRSTDNRMPQSIVVDSSENIYVSYHSIGTIRISGQGLLQWRSRIDIRKGMTCIIDEVSEGNILLSNNYITSPPFVSIVHLNNGIADSTFIKIKTEDRFSAIRISREKLIFTAGKYIFIKTGSKTTLLDSLPGVIYMTHRYGDNSILACTESGAYEINLDKPQGFSSVLLQSYSVTNFAKDREGGQWFTTLENGIFYTPGYGIKSIELDEFPELKPTCVSGDNKQAVIIGFSNGMLAKLENGRIKLLDIVPVENNYQPVINLTSFKGDEKVYLSRVNPGYLLNNSFYRLDRNKKFAIATDFIQSEESILGAGTAFLFRIIYDSLVDTFIVPHRINCLSNYGSKRILLGCNKGAFLFNTATKSLTPFHEELNDLRIDDIQSLGTSIVFATKGKGLVFYNKDKCILVDESKGLSSNLVNKILIDGNNVWCTTNKGISHLVLHDLEKQEFTITTINSGHGLLSDEINDIAELNDTIYCTTNKGISFFSTYTDFRKNIQPPVYITSLSLNNMETPLNQSMELSHNQNNIHIGFNGISYRSKEKITYRCSLISGDDTLNSFTQNRSIEFLSLRPGNYVFTVSAMNHSGIWSEKPATFSFTIKPAWWQSLGFRIVFTLLLVAVIFITYRRNVKKIKEKFEFEKKQAALQLTAMRAQMNPHFIFNVMNSIRNYMQDHDMQSAEKYLTSFSKLVRYTLDNSEVQEVTLEEELEALRNYAQLEMQRFNNGFEFTILCEEDIDPSETKLLSMLLQPYVENSIKHGISRMEKGGKILIDIRKKNNNLLIAIEDNGIGTQASSEWNSRHREHHVSFGTKINNERIEAYNKVYNKNIRVRIINLTDGEGKPLGTRVELEI